MGWGTAATVHAPSLDLMPNDCQLSHHVHRWVKDISPIAKNRKEKGRGQAGAEVGGMTHSRRGEPVNCHEGGLGFSQSFGKVGDG